MRSVANIGLFIFTILLMGCAHNSKGIPENFNSNYSLQIEGISDAAISDGLPDGITADTLSKSILSECSDILLSKGLSPSNQGHKYKALFSIKYFGHKWRGWRPKYYLEYSVKLIDVDTGIIISSNRLDSHDLQLTTVIEEACNDIIYFAIENIVKTNHP